MNGRVRVRSRVRRRLQFELGATYETVIRTRTRERTRSRPLIRFPSKRKYSPDSTFVLPGSSRALGLPPDHLRSIQCFFYNTKPPARPTGSIRWRLGWLGG